MFAKRLSAAVAASICFAMPAMADKLDEIKDRGVLKCGIHPGKAGFATPDAEGTWQGFDVDYCRALAAAVLGDATKVEFSTMSSKNRLTALVTDEIDVLSRTTTFTATRDMRNGVDVTTPWFYDGQGFLVKKALGVSSAADLSGATVCTYPGTTSERNVNDFFETNGMTYKALIIEGSAEAKTAYLAGRCDVITNDGSALAATRLGMSDADAHILLPDVISKEPLGPYVKAGEGRWRDVAAWTAMALIAAEEMGVTKANAASMAETGGPGIKRLLGSEGSIGEGLGLETGWARAAIEAVGNYGELFDHHLGANSPLAFERGLNAQWNEGGLLYAYPFR
ncbi:amino acid ABC transporter substrate-binding protein [Sulfitobacter mediterraneus]|uniref:amino acid ABC transporter substrate-binding protein n=1 Tax=Sulfitobacter mediterraneus TaxID=83219 RepID=UPI002491E72B|nr:amino acid ABC transporter substrate-binding protein [Sulfitobacter mediterraneus]